MAEFLVDPPWWFFGVLALAMLAALLVVAILLVCALLIPRGKAANVRDQE